MALQKAHHDRELRGFKMLPKTLTLDKAKQRFKKAFDEESKWYSLNDDVYDYFLPQRNIFDSTESGQNKMDKIFDSTSLEAIQEGASRIQENIAPAWKLWAKAEPTNQAREFIEQNEDDLDFTIDDVMKNLGKQSKIAFDYIHRSNFQTQFYEFLLDLMIGTATLKIDEEDDLDNPISFHTIPPKGIGYGEGANGLINEHWRKFSVKAKNLTETWKGFTPSQEVAAKIMDEPESMVKVCEGVCEEDGRFYGVAWVEGEDRYSWEADLENSSPFITGRWSKCSGEIRGRGPAMQSYPDVRSLNKCKEFVLQKAAIDLAGMYTAVDDGVTNPYNITISPGVVIPVGSNASSNPSIARLDTSTNLALAEFEMNELRNSIKKAFFNDLRDPEGPVRSATEVAIETRELAKRIGSAFGRLQTEVLDKILKRVFYILQKKGLINVEIDGVNTTVKFTSPLAAAQDQEDLIAIQQSVEFTLSTAGPEFVKASYAVERFGEYAGRLTGMPSELIRSEIDRNKAIQAGAEMAQTQMMEGQANVVE